MDEHLINHYKDVVSFLELRLRQAEENEKQQLSEEYENAKRQLDKLQNLNG